MSRKMVNALKAKVKELKHNDLKAKAITPHGWYEINSGSATSKDLNRMDITINEEPINNEFIRGLYSKHENLILKYKDGGGDYRPFLKEVFTEIFKSACATIPNDSIIEELITNYHQGGCFYFLPYNVDETLSPFSLLLLDSDSIRKYNMDCHEPDCLKLSFSMEYTQMFDDGTYIKTPGLCNLVEFKLKCKDWNVTYEDGKVLLTIPKELEGYKAGDDKLFDKFINIINKIIEYLKKLCEKLGFKFDTRIEYDSECNIKIEHNLGKPLKVINEPDVSPVEDLTFEVNNPR